MDCGLCVCLLIFPFSSYSRRSREHLLILGEQHDCICSKLCVQFRWVERNCILENLEMEILYLGMIYGDTVHFLFHSENSPQMCLSETRGSCRGSSTLNWRSDAHVHTEGCTARSLEETAFPLQAPGDFHPMEQGTAATSRGQETPQKLRTFTGAFFYTIFAFPCFNLFRIFFPTVKKKARLSEELRAPKKWIRSPADTERCKSISLSEVMAVYSCWRSLWSIFQDILFWSRIINWSCHSK